MCHLTASYQSFGGRIWQREADEYLQDVKSKRKTMEVTSVENLVMVEIYLFGSSTMAVIILQVASGVALLQNNEVLLAIQDISTRIDRYFDKIDTRLDGIDTRLSNSSAYGPACPLRWVR